VTPTLRLARPDDAAAVLAIYGPVVKTSATSFELEVPSEEEIRRRIEATLERWPWLICEDEAGVAGYAYGTRHRERGAYQWSADVAVYVAPRAQSRGVGRALYGALLELLVMQGFCNAYAGITLPNPASVGLHEALGFRHLGVYRGVGHKHGRWHDVGWWHLELRPLPERPEPPSPLPTVLGTDSFGRALASASAGLARGFAARG
jgi:L-amino acid N-acyltransferase YncA